mmetsp:Transcript_116257/g.163427  ORF Transcript_116257/g.163427 Transcript_116257/m.163427 type:complete len:137 (-) Transcript_116257:266-676(-)
MGCSGSVAYDEYTLEIRTQTQTAEDLGAKTEGFRPSGRTLRNNELDDLRAFGFWLDGEDDDESWSVCSYMWETAPTKDVIPPGVPLPPGRRLHEKHLRRMNKFLDGVTLYPNELREIVQKKRTRFQSTDEISTFQA